MVMSSPSKCPLCRGLEPSLRCGLDDLFAKTHDREEYEILETRFKTQARQDTLSITELVCEPDKDGSIVIKMYARCSNCSAIWETEHRVVPIKGDDQ